MEYEIQTINEIPHHLLLEILSWLQTKNIVASSILSKRWQSLLEDVKTFIYDGQPIGKSYWRFVRVISKRSSLEKLQLKLKPYFDHSNIKALINIAVTRCLKELRIEMVYNSFQFPKSFYVSSHLETLILKKLFLVNVPSNVSLIYLKRLHLLSVKFSGDHSVKTLLSICPCLEDLVVRRSSYTNVIIFTIDVPTLRTLSIDNTLGSSRPKGVHGFVINAPSMKSFTIRDIFSNHLRFANMPELVKASVEVVCYQPDKFIGSFASTKYLSLCFVTSQSPYPSIGSSFLFLVQLELCSCSKEWCNDDPRLRVLKLKVFKKHSVQYDSMDLGTNLILFRNAYHLIWRSWSGDNTTAQRKR